MIGTLYEIYGITSSDVAIVHMAQNATTISAVALVAVALIVAILLGSLLWHR